MTARVALTERQFQSQVMDLARRCGWKVWHFHDSRRQVRRQSRPGRPMLVGDKDAAGFPDLVLVHTGTGRTLFRELKSATGRPTPDQSEALAILSAAGHDADIWRPADWNETIIPTLTRRNK